MQVPGFHLILVIVQLLQKYMKQGTLPPILQRYSHAAGAAADSMTACRRAPLLFACAQSGQESRRGSTFCAAEEISLEAAQSPRDPPRSLDPKFCTVRCFELRI